MLAVAAGALAFALVVLAVVLGSGGDGGNPPGGSEQGVTTIPLPGAPGGIAVGEGGTWVARYDAGEVSRIDAGSNRVDVEVGAHPTKVAAGEGAVWVGYDDGRRLARIDPETRTVTERIDLNDPDGCACTLDEIAIAEGQVWVGAADRRAIVTFDVETGEQARLVYHPGQGFDGVFTVADGAVWAVGTADFEPYRSFLMRFTIGSGDVERTQLATESYFAALAYGDGIAWIGDADDARNEVLAVDAGTRRVIRRIPITTGVMGDDLVLFRGDLLVWDPFGGWLTAIDARERRVVDRGKAPGFGPERSRGDGPARSDIAADGDSTVWATDPVRNLVYRLDES